ncbi:MAG TPA: S-layer homology domain-containing protein, partial [Paenibacillus sp.]
PNDLKASITIQVMPEVIRVAEIVTVQDLESKSVPFGTPFNGLKLPSSVIATLNNGETKAISIDWNSEGYNGDKQGAYILKGALVPVEGISNPKDLKAFITINVLPEIIAVPEITAVQELTSKSVAYGTSFNELELPASVTVTLSSRVNKVISVQWNKEGYNGNTEGTYTIKGDLVLPEGVANTLGLKVQISVIVKPYSGGSGGDGGQPSTPTPVTPAVPSVPSVSGEVVKPGEQQPQSPGTDGKIKTPELIRQELKNKFKDATLIPSWAESAIAALVERNIIGGRTDGSFDPSGKINRAEFVAMVVKSFDFSMSENQKPFTDVLEGAWYRNYVEIGTSNHLINGIGNGMFAPNRSISRQDLCVILFNALKKLNVELPQAANHDFPDDASIAGYAKEAVYAFKDLGIVNGGSGGAMDPTASATRAEAAVIIKNVLDYYASVTSSELK